MYPFQTFILPYFYHKKSTEEEKLEKIETAVTKLQGNMVDTGKFCQQLLFLLVVLDVSVCAGMQTKKLILLSM